MELCCKEVQVVQAEFHSIYLYTLRDVILAKHGIVCRRLECTRRTRRCFRHMMLSGKFFSLLPESTSSSSSVQTATQL